MKRNIIIILAAIIIGIFHWIFDAFRTYTVSDNVSFFGTLINDIPSDKVFFRSLMIVSITVLGIILVMILNYRRKLIEAIEESERYYRNAFDQAAVGFAHLNIDGQYLRVNQKYCDFVGYSKSELKTKKFWEFAHPEDHKEANEIIDDLVSGKSNRVHIERRMKFKGDKWGWANLSISVVRKPNSDFEYFNLVVEDVTEHKNLLEKMRIDEERYRSIFESTASCIAVYKPINNGEDFVFVDFNPMAENLEGIKKEELIGKKVTEVFPGVEAFGLLDTFRQVLKTNKTVHQPISLYKDDRIESYRENTSYKLSTGEVVSLYQDVTQRKKNEDKLRFQAELLDQIQDKITATNLNGVITYVNDAVCRDFNKTKYELIGQSVLCFGENPDLGATQQEIIDETLSEGFWRGEVVNRIKDGKEIILDCKTQLIRDKNDKPIAMIGISSDITQRKLTEKSLKESEEKYRQLAELLPEAIFECDTELNLTYFNKRASEIFGYDEEDVRKGLNGVQMIAPEDRTRAVANAVKRINKKEYGSTEYFAIRKDGSRFPILLHTSPNYKDGTLIGLRGVIVDITRSKEAERKLKESKEIQDAILSATDVSLAYMDKDFNFIAVNQAYADAGKQDREFFIGKNHFALYPNEDNEAIFRKAVETGEKQTKIAKAFEYPNQPERGVTYWDWSVNPVRNEFGKVQSLILSLMEVTDRVKNAEHIKSLEEQIRQAQKMEAIGMLAGGIAHDFNNILNVILGYSELLLSHFKTDEFPYPKITAIKNNAERASNLTRQLLAFSRKQILNTESIIVNEIIRDMEKMLKRIINENIEFTSSLQDDLHSITADKGQIEQIIMNLAVNAKDAMPDGGEFTIKTQNIEIDDQYENQYNDLKPGNYVLISIQDTGSGMSDEVLSKIFEPFYTTKEHGKGTGLGLSTVYGIVKQSEGNIYVKSEVGKGTTFEIFFPAEPIDKNPRKHKISDPNINKNEVTILVVEDNQSMCDMLAEILEIGGYKSYIVSNPIKAIDLYRKHFDEIEMMLSDVIMPDMSGKRLADTLHEINPNLKVLFMSGYTDSAIVHQGILDEGTHFIQKPFTIKELLKKINSTLEDDDSEPIL